MRIVVAGALANKPRYGGEAWVRLAWIRGLDALGARVLFVEELHPTGAGEPRRPARGHPGVEFFEDVCAAFGLDARAALITPAGDSIAGVGRDAVLDFAEGADLLVNLSGHLTRPEIVRAVRRRAYVDLDPGFTQFWHAAGMSGLRLLEHDVHFTVGTNVGTPLCPVPTSGIPWIPVLPPTLLDAWPVAEPVEGARFTTVTSWRGAYGAPSHDGHSYSLKAHAFRTLAALPRRAPASFELALDIHPGDARDRRFMEAHGWRLVDPRVVAGTPWAFQEYVADSVAEFSAAQGVYTDTASGWFSDRSANYLAAGRPVVGQDTGFGRTVPVGDGIVTFRDLAGARRAVRDVLGARRHHEVAARQIAEEHFDARRVLSRFLDRSLPDARPRGLPDAAVTPRRPSPPRPLRPRPVLVSGMVARVPGQGGAAWAVLQYVLGLLQLGHDVHLVEEVGPEDLIPAGASLVRSRTARHFRHVVRQFGLDGRATLFVRGTRDAVGVPWAHLCRRLGNGAVLINLSGVLRDEELRRRAPVRVYVDLDPAFTQLWHEVSGVDVGLDGHTHFATVGLRVGRPGWRLPTCGRTWIPTLPPVVLDHWRPRRPGRPNVLTTVANWRSYGSIHWDGDVFGQKAHAFRGLLDLPALAGEARFDLALAIHEDERSDLDALRRNGWGILDPERVAGTPGRYMRFLGGSSAELCVAKTGYVVSESGWFSDRSACYLACGRPVLAQDTGFPDALPTGEGLLAFRTADDAAENVRRMRREYRRHARAARRIAEEHFDARQVLGRLMREVER